MRPRFWSLSARLSVGTLLGVLTWGLLAPAAVRASCGDYVTVPSQHAPQSTPRPPVAHPEAPPARPVPPLPEDDLPRPCPGPGCSAPAAPEPTTAPAPVRSTDDWPAATWGVQISPEAPLGKLDEPGRSPGKRRPTAVYRPPRLA